MIHIKEPYWSAWQRYGWEKNIPGIGINTKEFRGEGNMEIRIGKDKRVYMIDREAARDIVRRYNSFFWAKTTKLAVLPQSSLSIK